MYLLHTPGHRTTQGCLGFCFLQHKNSFILKVSPQFFFQETGRIWSRGSLRLCLASLLPHVRAREAEVEGRSPQLISSLAIAWPQAQRDNAALLSYCAQHMENGDIQGATKLGNNSKPLGIPVPSLWVVSVNKAWSRKLKAALFFPKVSLSLSFPKVRSSLAHHI